MKLFTCTKCSNLLYFENSVCLNCGHTLGFDAIKLNLITLVSEGVNGLYSDATDMHIRYRRCNNAVHGTCNWLIPEHVNASFCIACELNRTIPALNVQNRERWERIEVAKHRLIYSLLRLGLPLKPKQNPEGDGLAFDFLADAPLEERVLTGHENGVITLNIEEADEEERVKNKLDLGEKYRTLLGHFRHEIGHYYWDVLIRDYPS